MSNNAVATTKKDVAGNLVKSLEQSFASALPTHLTKEHFSRALLTEFRRTPALLECTKESLGAGVLLFAQLGLMIGVNGQGWLIPFNDRKKNCKNAVVVIGYQGMIDLCYRSDRVESITADVICENDEFKFVQGFDQVLRHVPNLRGPRGEPYAVYAIANIKGGNRPVAVVMNKEEVMKVKASSPGAKKSDSPWNGAFESEMWKKTALNRLCKFLPKSVELISALDFESKQAGYMREVSAEVVDDEPLDEPLKLGTSSMRDKPRAKPNPRKTEPTPPAEEVIQQEPAAKIKEIDEVEEQTSEPEKVSVPPAYTRLSTYYGQDEHMELVNDCLSQVGLPKMERLVWQDLDDQGIKLLKRAAAKVAKAISE